MGACNKRVSEGFMFGLYPLHKCFCKIILVLASPFHFCSGSLAPCLTTQSMLYIIIVFYFWYFHNMGLKFHGDVLFSTHFCKENQINMNESDKYFFWYLLGQFIFFEGCWASLNNLYLVMEQESLLPLVTTLLWNPWLHVHNSNWHSIFDVELEKERKAII